MNTREYRTCMVRTAYMHGRLIKRGRFQLMYIQVNFQGNQKDVGIVEVNKVNKQGKDCKGSCTAALYVTNKVKYPEPFHITIPIYISSWKPLIASNCSYLCRDGYVERCMVLYTLFVAHRAVVQLSLQSFPCLLTLFTFTSYPCIFLTSWKSFLFT